ncbi:MAG: NFYB/HAP3 family transcription factor subunit [Nanoarchaeota archaeon]|nr:NFYB/HAP3 family transcription factor subunit [Nanoarchaeota archaeon]
MSELLVVRSKIKDAAKGMNVASDFADHLSKKVEEMINQAVERAKENNRKTIQPKDL